MDEWRNYRVYQGGLMRCCLLTLQEFMATEAQQPPQEGDLLHCRYHADNGGMIFHDGAWRWNKPED